MAEKDYWFKAKRYGYGWYPAKLVGWLLVAGYCALVYGLAVITIGRQDPHTSDLAQFIIGVAVLTIALVVIGYKKGEPPRWRWGK